MVRNTIASDTMTTMLLQEKQSVSSVNGRAFRGATGTTSTADEVPVTAAARQILEQDLASLRVEQRAIPGRLRVAREFGDTANNDEHLAIREEEAVLARRIVRLEDILSRATEVDHAGEDGSVTIGSTVTVVDADTRERLEYVIGSAHGVLSRGTVSALSPVGQALLGRRVGERVSVELPRGRRRELELSGVRHPSDA
jgi:transcription elongation factor GreA